MAIQTMGLDYGWLVDLARLISEKRVQPTGVGGGTQSVAPYAGPTSSFQEGEESAVSKQVRLAREDKLLENTRKHEITMQKLQNESPLAVALAQGRAGTEQTKIAGAAQVAAAQKTTADKAKETIDLLLQMTPEGRMEALNALEAKDAEFNAAGTPSGGTITSPGKPPITLPGSAQRANPNSPLTQIFDTFGVDARTVIANLQGKGTQPETFKDQVEQLRKIADDQLGGVQELVRMIQSPGGQSNVATKIQEIGKAYGYSDEVINAVMGVYGVTVAPMTAVTGGGENVPPKKVPLGTRIAGVAKGGTLGLGEPIRAALHPEESKWSPEYVAQRGQWEEAAAKQPEVGQESFIRNLSDFLETAFRGPFAGGVTTTPPAEKKVGQQVGPTIEDAITDMDTWDAKTIKAFQKKAGIKVDGKMSQGLKDAMKVYFKKHKDEWR